MNTRLPPPRIGLASLALILATQTTSLFGDTFDWIKIESFRASIVSGSTIQPVVSNVSNPYCNWENMDTSDSSIAANIGSSSENHSSQKFESSDPAIANFIAAAYAQGIFEVNPDSTRTLERAEHRGRARNEYFDIRSNDERKARSTRSAYNSPRGSKNNESSELLPEYTKKPGHTATTTLVATQLPFNNPVFTLNFQKRSPNYAYISNGVSFASITRAVSVPDEASTIGLFALGLMTLIPFARRKRS